MGSSASFGSMDEFLLHILTLRSNSVYREDFALLAKEADSGDWVKTQPLDGRGFGAARSLVATWDLICRIAAGIPAADKNAKDQDLARFRM